MSRLGRIPKIDHEVVIETLLQYKTIILLSDSGDKIVSKQDEVWVKISHSLGGKKVFLLCTISCVITNMECGAF